MAQNELRRRIKQRDVLMKRLEDPVVLADDELAARIRASLGETEQRIEQEQAAQAADESGDTRRRRR